MYVSILSFLILIYFSNYLIHTSTYSLTPNLCRLLLDDDLMGHCLHSFLVTGRDSIIPFPTNGLLLLGVSLVKSMLYACHFPRGLM